MAKRATHKLKRTRKAKAAPKTAAAIIKSSFTIVTDMEDDVQTASDFADAVAYIAQTINEQDVGCVVQRIAWTIKEHIKSLENRRGDLFDLLFHHGEVQS